VDSIHLIKDKRHPRSLSLSIFNVIFQYVKEL